MAIIKPKISIIILAGNEESVITDCLKSCLWSDELILVAANSTDNTVNIAKKLSSRIRVISTFDEYNKNFSKWRNLGLSKSTGQWILYVDSDERLTPPLIGEIKKIIQVSPPPFSYYVIPRANHFLGQRVKHGGTYPDYVKRLFLRSSFKGFTGKLHEEPVVSGDFGYLKADLLHYTHRQIYSMVQKSIAWTDMEAKELYLQCHPPVYWWRFPRMMLTKFFQRLVLQQMWRDGIVGWISAIFESFDTFMIYARLWELQQQKPKRL